MYFVHIKNNFPSTPTTSTCFAGSEIRRASVKCAPAGIGCFGTMICINWHAITLLINASWSKEMATLARDVRLAGIRTWTKTILIICGALLVNKATSSLKKTSSLLEAENSLKLQLVFAILTIKVVNNNKIAKLTIKLINYHKIAATWQIKYITTKIRSVLN